MNNQKLTKKKDVLYFTTVTPTSFNGSPIRFVHCKIRWKLYTFKKTNLNLYQEKINKYVSHYTAVLQGSKQGTSYY